MVRDGRHFPQSELTRHKVELVARLRRAMDAFWHWLRSALALCYVFLPLARGMRALLDSYLVSAYVPLPVQRQAQEGTVSCRVRLGCSGRLSLLTRTSLSLSPYPAG